MSLKKTAAAVVAAAAMLAGTACSAATQNAGQAAATAAGPARNGGKLVVAQAYDPDPASFPKTAIGNIVTEYAVLETLTLIDAETGEPKGVLAKSWTLAPDGKSMTVQLRDDVPVFKAGDTLRVHFKVIEGNRQRVQVFEGICLKRQGSGVRETFTVRKNSFGVGVERTFPLHSPKIEKLEVAMIGDVNRAKLYYLRGRVGKKARIRELRQQ